MVKGEYKIFYRRKLPHLQPLEGTFFITYRLHNSLPKSLLKQLKIEFEYDKMKAQGQRGRLAAEHKQEALNHIYQEYFKKLDAILDKIVDGVSYLKNEKVAKIVADSLHYWDNKKLDLICYCIMPNHVHAVFTLYREDTNGKIISLDDMMKSIKGVSARYCNQVLGLKGQFWHHESYDRLVRDRDELDGIIAYVLDNPVKAGLCENRKDWQWSYIREEFNEYL